MRTAECPFCGQEPRPSCGLCQTQCPQALWTEPLKQRAAKLFIAAHHRHHDPPRGWKFGLGIYRGSLLVGVVWVGRPVNRHLDDRTTLEVNRLCVRTDVDPALTRNACSKGYAAAAKEARAQGYSKLVTYTLDTESGHSLKCSGWIEAARTEGGSWDCPSRPRADHAPITQKIRWERLLRRKSSRTG